MIDSMAEEKVAIPLTSEVRMQQLFRLRRNWELRSVPHFPPHFPPWLSCERSGTGPFESKPESRAVCYWVCRHWAEAARRACQIVMASARLSSKMSCPNFWFAAFMATVL